MNKLITTFFTLIAIIFAPVAFAAEVPVLVSPVNPNVCTGGRQAFEVNEFGQWNATGCRAMFPRDYIMVVNATTKCIVPNWEGHSTRSLVPTLETIDGVERRVSTAVNTAEGVRACQKACSITYTFQPDDRATLTAVAYQLPIGVEPLKRIVDGAAFQIIAARRFDAERGVDVALMATPVATWHQENILGVLGGDRVVFQEANACPNMHKDW